jgi:uncharacterized membrane protein
MTTFINLTDIGSETDPFLGGPALENFVAEGILANDDPILAGAATVELLSTGGADLVTNASPPDPTTGEALFTFLPAGNTSGSGQFPSILRVGANTVEEGFNSTDPKNTLNDVPSIKLTHSLPLADLQATGPGNAYYEFTLDIAQPGQGQISLDELKFYTSNNIAIPSDFHAGSTQNGTAGNGFISGDQLIGGADGTVFHIAYDLGSNDLLLTAHKGNGHDDYLILVPIQDFNASDTYVTIFAKFGGVAGFLSAGSYEEFGALTNPSVPVSGQGSFTIEKDYGLTGVNDVSNTGSVDHAGQTIYYTITVTNTGTDSLTLAQVLAGQTQAVVDSILDSQNHLTGPSGIGLGSVLAAGGSWVFHTTHSVTQQDIDDNGNNVDVPDATVTTTPTDPGFIDNIAAVDFIDNSTHIDLGYENWEVQTPIVQNPDISITKTASTTATGGWPDDLIPDPTDTGQVDHNGQEIDYKVVIKNTGNETLTNVVVTDPFYDDGLGGHVLGTLATLAPGASHEFDFSINATQDQIDNGSDIVNTATVTEDQGITKHDSATTQIDQDPSLSITKTASTTATGGWPDDLIPDPTDTGQVDHNGQEIDYKIVVKNTGNETLTNVVVTDPFYDDGLGGHVLGTLPTLAVGASHEFDFSINATQDQIDSGKDIVNTATATDNQGDNQSDTATVSIDQDPSLSIKKTVSTTAEGGWPDDSLPDSDASNTGLVDTKGQEIDYKIVVTNTGNETLTNVVVTDPFYDDGLGGHVLGTLPTLAVGDSHEFDFSIKATQDQIDSGKDIVNTATVTDNQGDNQSDSATVSIDQDPSLSIKKTVSTTAEGGWPDDATDAPGADTGQVDTKGQEIDYKIVVTNTGNMTLTNVVVTDPFYDDGKGGHVLGTLPTLAVGASQEYDFHINATQAQIDSGADIVNTATATDDQKDNQSDTATVKIDQDPSINVEKLVSVDGGHNWYFQTASGDSYDSIAYISQAIANATIPHPSAAQVAAIAATLHIGTPSTPEGSTVQFEFIVTNTGNVDFTDVTLADNKYSLGNPDVGALNVGGAALVTGTNAVSVKAVLGGLTNTVTATGTYDTSQTVHDSDSVAYVGAFVENKPGLTIGYWYNHTIETRQDPNHHWGTEVYYAGGGSGGEPAGWGILLGDETGTAWVGHGMSNAITSIPVGMLFIPDQVAAQLINSSQSANDTRQTLISQAMAAQLNVNTGDIAPAGLLTEAVKWLNGTYTFADNSSGNTDLNGNRVIDIAGTTGTTNGSAHTQDYNTSATKFTFEGPPESTPGIWHTTDHDVANGSLTSSSNAWNAYTSQMTFPPADPFFILPAGMSSDGNGTHGAIQADGEGLKNALAAFNQNQLQTDNFGHLAWNGNSFEINNGLNDFWAVLAGAGVTGVHFY